MKKIQLNLISEITGGASTCEKATGAVGAVFGVLGAIPLFGIPFAVGGGVIAIAGFIFCPDGSGSPATGHSYGPR